MKKNAHKPASSETIKFVIDAVETLARMNLTKANGYELHRYLKAMMDGEDCPDGDYHTLSEADILQGVLNAHGLNPKEEEAGAES